MKTLILLTLAAAAMAQEPLLLPDTLRSIASQKWEANRTVTLEHRVSGHAYRIDLRYDWREDLATPDSHPRRVEVAVWELRPGTSLNGTVDVVKRMKPFRAEVSAELLHSTRRIAGELSPMSERGKAELAALVERAKAGNHAN